MIYDFLLYESLFKMGKVRRELNKHKENGSASFSICLDIHSFQSEETKTMGSWIYLSFSILEKDFSIGEDSRHLPQNWSKKHKPISVLVLQF